MFKMIAVFLLVAFSATSYALNKDFHVSKRGTETWINLKFNASSSRSADVLFVIDDSGSMQLHQQNLAKNVTELVTLLPQSSLHAGVITTTMSTMYTKPGFTPGQLISGVLKGGSPQFATDLQKAILAGTNGDHQELPFDSIFTALSEPLLSNANKGFLRDNADLYVIILTDTQDQSKMDEAALAAHLKSLKPNQSITTIAGMVTDPNTCPGETTELQNQPPKIQNLVNLTGGSIFSLCGDFAKNLTDAIQTAVITENTVVLPKTDDNKSPVYASIKISIAGDVFLAGDTQSTWIYDSLTRTVTFSEAMLQKSLQVGAPIEIVYQVQ